MSTISRWEYANGAYETCTSTDALGAVTQYQRSIIGPIPQNDPTVIAMISNIDPNNQNWQQILIQGLAANHFFTQNIAQARGTEIDLKTVAYLKSERFLWNAAKTSAAATAVIALGFAPSIVAKIAPNAVKALKSHPEAEEPREPGVIGFLKSNVSYSVKGWWKILRADVMEDKILGGTLSLVGGFSLIALSKNLFDELNKTLGSDEYTKWKQEKLAVLTTHKPIPQEFEDDPVLSQNLCSISGAPVRIPSMLNCQHVFEEAMIVNWIVQQNAYARTPSCPLCRRVIIQSTINVALSDLIEMRLFLLEARKANHL